ncbi:MULTISPECIES: hypothetical protein [Streptomyces]|uniref:hypothetical protein n=1 Tax=Streptomyces TaxID=1883 RepID=UPI0003A6B461|nr:MULTISPECIES: hypothetical protein [Streptomyces]MBZ6176588.1 hypothetical protein [Streptomyces olivaceus]MBZ6254130.1 hypothetical protein [Streptomyces olivaceus]MCM8552678.1 hypothetical protein [Streptomyces sp. STCH 565 A]MCU8590830.1 hypothetical protein [Streptomyces sp. A13(2022)]UOG78026.1 hypothetical protein L6J92_01820 [Streptomyces sp. CB09030]
MGWTHDYSDVARDGRSTSGVSSTHRPGGTPQLAGADLRVGIPHILRRRARWVSARLRHPRT